MNDEMTRFRSAYAAAKKESVGEHNAKELADAIPNPPSAAAPKAAWDSWRATMSTLKDELYDIRKGHLANAGVSPRDVARQNPSSAPVKHVKMPDGRVLNFDAQGNQVQ